MEVYILVNMDFSKNEIQDFQGLYEKYFNIVLSDDEAKRKLNLLIRQMAVVYKRVSVEQYENFRITLLTGLQEILETSR